LSALSTRCAEKKERDLVLEREVRLANLRDANGKKTASAKEAVLAALRRHALEGLPVNINAVARTAGVSRGFIYAQPELREQVAEAAARSRTQMRSPSATPNEASLRARLETALDTIRELKEENGNLKQRIENLAAQLYEESVGS
jgi:hypothetical protein